jgi:hypothetical protein
MKTYIKLILILVNKSTTTKCLLGQKLPENEDLSGKKWLVKDSYGLVKIVSNVFITLVANKAMVENKDWGALGPWFGSQIKCDRMFLCGNHGEIV